MANNNKDSDIDGSSDSEVYTIIEESNCSDSSDSKPASSVVYSFDNLLSNGNNLSEKESPLEGKANTYEFVDKYFKSKSLKNLASTESEEEMLVLDEDSATGKEPLVSEVSSEKNESKQLSEDELTLPISLANILPKIHTTCNPSGNEDSSVTNTKFMENSQWEPPTEGELECTSPRNFVQIDSTLLAQPVDVVKTGIDKLEMNEIMPSENADQNINIIGEKILPSFSSANKLLNSELQKIHESPETKTRLSDSKSLLTEEKTKQIIDKVENNTEDSGIVEKNSIEKTASEYETSLEISSQKFTRNKFKETISNSDTDSNCSIKVINEGLSKTIEDEQNIPCDSLQKDNTNNCLNKNLNNLSETNDFSNNNVELGETTNSIDTKEQSKKLTNVTIIIDKNNCHISVNPENVIESESIYQEDSYSKLTGISLVKPCTVKLNRLSLESVNLKDEPCSVYNSIFKNLKEIDNQKDIDTKSKKNKSGVCVKSDKQAKAAVKRKEILKKPNSQHTAKTSPNRKKTFKISKKWLESKKPSLKFDDIESNIDSEKDNMMEDVQTPENNEKPLNVTSMDNNEESIMMLEVQTSENEEQVNMVNTKDNKENVMMQEVLPPENKKQINVTNIDNMEKFLLKENAKVTDLNMSKACLTKPCKIVLHRLPCNNFQLLMDKKLDKCLKSDNEEIIIDSDDEIDRKSSSSIEDNCRILTPSRGLKLTKLSSVHIKEMESDTSIKNLCISKRQSRTKSHILTSDSEDSDIEIINIIQNKRKSKNKFSKSSQNSTFGETDESNEYSGKANNADDIIEQKIAKLKNSKSKKKIGMKQTYKHKNIDVAKENLDSSIKSRRIKKNTLQVSKSDQNYFKNDLEDSDINNEKNAIDTEQPKRKSEVRSFNSKNTLVKYDESEKEPSSGDEIVFSDSNHSSISSVKIPSLGDLYKSFDPSMKKNSLNKQIPKQVADNLVRKAFTNYKKLEQSEYDLNFNSLIKPCKVILHPLTPDQYLTAYCVELNVPHCNDIDDCSLQYHSKKSSRTKRQFLKRNLDVSINDLKEISKTKSMKNSKQNSRILSGKSNDANKNKLNFEKQDEFEGRTKQKSKSKVATSDKNNESQLAKNLEANEPIQSKDGEKEDIYLENNLKGESLNHKEKSKPCLKISSHTKHFTNSIKNYIDNNSDSNENNIEHEQSEKLVMCNKKYQLNDKNNDKLKNVSFIDQEGSFLNSSNILPSFNAVPSFNELLANNDHSLEEKSLIKSHQIFKETSENIAGFVKEGNIQIKIDQTTDTLNFNSLIKPCKVILHRYSFENKRLLMENCDENPKSCNEQLISNCNSGYSNISKNSSKYKRQTLKFSDSDDELDDVQDRKQKLEKDGNNDFDKMQRNCDSESDNIYRNSLPTKKSKQSKKSFDDNRSDSKFNRSKHNTISKVKSLSKRLQKENLHKEHDEFHSDDSIRCRQVKSVRKLGNDTNAESCSTKNDEIADFNLINSGVSDKKNTECKKNQSELELSISKKSLQDKVHNSKEIFSVSELAFSDSSCNSVTTMEIPAFDELLSTIDNSLENESFLIKDIPKQISNSIDNSIHQKHSKPVIEKLNFTSLIKPCKVILHRLTSDIETDYQIILCTDKYEKEKNVSKNCQKMLSHQPKKSVRNDDSSKERKSNSTKAKRGKLKNMGKSESQLIKRLRNDINASKIESSDDNQSIEKPTEGIENQRKKSKENLFKTKTMSTFLEIGSDTSEKDSDQSEEQSEENRKLKLQKLSSKIKLQMESILSSENSDDQDDLLGQKNKDRPVLKKTLNKTLVKSSNRKLSSTVKRSIKLTSDDETKSEENTDLIKSQNQGKKRKKSSSKHKDHLKINASSESDDSYNQEEEIELKNKRKKSPELEEKLNKCKDKLKNAMISSNVRKKASCSKESTKSNFKNHGVKRKLIFLDSESDSNF